MFVEETHTLAVCFRHGSVYLMSGPDDPCPHIVHTFLTGRGIYIPYQIVFFAPMNMYYVEQKQTKRKVKIYKKIQYIIFLNHACLYNYDSPH